MTLDQLRYFQAVCKYNSVSRASEVLCISQPSVSLAISKLEDEFGVMLFARHNKRLMITKEGTVLLKYAETVLADADDTVKRMKELSDSKVLNLGIPPMISSYVLPILYGEFFKKYPELKVNIIEDDRSGLINMFDDNRINMAFLPHEGVWDHKLNSEMMVELDSVCCMPKDHPLAKRRSVSVKDLENEDLILFKNSFFQTERILKRFRQNDVEPNVIFNTAQVSTIQSIVSNGLAVSFIFKFLLESTPKLIGVPLEPPMRTKVSLVWKQGEYLSGDMLRLIKFVKNYYEKTESHREQ